MSLRTLITPLATLLLCACTDREPRQADYFPLTEGMHWSYRVTTDHRGGDASEGTFAVRNTGAREIDGSRYAVRLTDQGTRYFVRPGDHGGWYRGAKQTVVETAPVMDDPVRWILRPPLQVGSNWSSETHPYVLHRVHPYQESLGDGVTFKMNYQIADTDDVVDVPAGRFTHCIRVEGDGVISLYTDGRSGYQDIAVTTTEWYAPTVGLVKLVRAEPFVGDVFVGGSTRLELESFAP